MKESRVDKKEKRRVFAVASLGAGRWYWVVWPSAEETQVAGGGRHVQDGYEPNKAEAVDRALAVAGFDGEWVAAKFAKQYHRQLSRAKRGQANSQAAPVMLEFLYQDVPDPAGGWVSVPHRVVKKSQKYVYVERQPYQAEARSGTWLDAAGPVIRLNRALLETEGYTLAPVIDIDDPLFFTTPYQARTGQTLACFSHLGLAPACTTAEVKAAYRRLVKRVHPDQGGSHDEFLRLQAAYEQALRICQAG